MKKFTADFETNIGEDKTNVWAWAICTIDGKYDCTFGNSIATFIEWCRNNTNSKVYFHNLKFDGEFIISFLLSNGYTHVESFDDVDKNTFMTLISDMGQFYSITLFFSRKKKVAFIDSLKIFPNFSVERVAEGFNLSIHKLTIDYKKWREENHQLTIQEINYIKNDVTIMAQALDIMFAEGHTRMTIAGDAFKSFEEFNPDFRSIFPLLDKEMDADIRKAYRGGFTYVNPRNQDVIVNDGVVLDVNSLYPAMMLKNLPYGKPEFFEGKYKTDRSYPLYIQSLTCLFSIKPNKIPSIQLKHNLSFMPNEYIESTNGEIVTLSLCKPDLELFFEHYNVNVLSYNGGWKFKNGHDLFKSYIDFWTAEKIKAGKEHNAPKRQIAKLMLNSLYGRMGMSPISASKIPYLDDGIVKYQKTPDAERNSIYIPVACFITAYGRTFTIRTSQAVRDYTMKKYGKDGYFYSDTDSIHAHLSDDDIKELSKVIPVDDYKIGYWCKESNFQRAKFIRQKCYIEEIDGQINATVAGLPKSLAPIINFDNFQVGFTTEGLSEDDLKRMARNNGASEEEIEKIHHKLRYAHVKGGVVLKDTPFTIK